MRRDRHRETDRMGEREREVRGERDEVRGKVLTEREML